MGAEDSRRQALGRQIIKAYPQRGPLQQYRLSSPQTFHCFRCGASKTARLVTVYGGDWNRLLCNGCYGYLLAVHEIKAGSASDDERSNELARVLLQSIHTDDVRSQSNLLLAKDGRTEQLSERTLRFLATAMAVGNSLKVAGDDLDWSPAVIGLCKALETELVRRIIDPIKVRAQGEDLSADLSDNELKRVARYCATGDVPPPELGSIAFFIRVCTTSERRYGTSPLCRIMRRLAANQRDGAWLTSPTGLTAVVSDITKKYRNPAAHISEVTAALYDECLAAVIGANGALWALLAATNKITPTTL